MSGIGEGIKNENDEQDIHALLEEVFTDGKLNISYQELATQLFSFPFAKAYAIQLEFALSILKAIQDKKVGVFESPTGTGKTFSLLCGAATWQTTHIHNQERHYSKYSDSQSEKKRPLESLDQNIAKAEGSPSSAQKIRYYREGLVQNNTSDEPSWSEFYKEEPFSESSSCSIPIKTSSSFISLQEDKKRVQGINESVSQIIFATRTHTQLEQFINELKKTVFGKEIGLVGKSLRTVSFASRKQLCINEKVQTILQKKGIEAMNETCLDMKRNLMKKKKAQKNVKGKEKSYTDEKSDLKEICNFMHRSDDGGIAKEFKEYANAVQQQPRDIEELIELGNSMKTCPYYGAREAAKGAQLITMTYDLLLNASARKSIGLSLFNSIVIIDEAHNIIDKILQINSIVLTASQVNSALALIRIGKGMAENVPSYKHKAILHKLEEVLRRLDNFCSETKDEAPRCMTPENFILSSGEKIDQSIMLRLDEWLSDDESDLEDAGEPAINIEIEGNDKEKEKEDGLQQFTRSIRIIVRPIAAFLKLVTDPALEGRIHLPDPKAQSSTKEIWSLKYQLLDPAVIFEGIIDKARCVILAGGTMKPLSDFTDQLFPQMNQERFTHFESLHNVPKENIVGAIVRNSISGAQLKYTYKSRSLPDTLVELTEMLIEISKVVPHGIVVFVPSYTYLDGLKRYWDTTGYQYRQQLKAQKCLFFEPKNSSDVDEVLTQYRDAIDHTDPPNHKQRKKGALLLAVVNAKLSEGINFKDNMGRAVIVVGLPYPWSEDPELQERQEFIKRLYKKLESDGKCTTNHNFNRGWELYINSCMKSVNQSIGRVIRHQNDYAAIILLDGRYELPEHRSRLPIWIQNSTSTYEKFDGLITKLKTFFQTRSDH